MWFRIINWIEFGKIAAINKASGSLDSYYHSRVLCVMEALCSKFHALCSLCRSSVFSLPKLCAPTDKAMALCAQTARALFSDCTWIWAPTIKFLISNRRSFPHSKGHGRSVLCAPTNKAPQSQLLHALDPQLLGGVGSVIATMSIHLLQTVQLLLSAWNKQAII